jgi:hypothetical protein
MFLQIIAIGKFGYLNKIAYNNNIIISLKYQKATL